MEAALPVDPRPRPSMVPRYRCSYLHRGYPRDATWRIRRSQLEDYRYVCDHHLLTSCRAATPGNPVMVEYRAMWPIDSDCPGG